MPACVSSTWGFIHTFIVVSNSWVGARLKGSRGQASPHEIQTLGACSHLHASMTRSSADRASSATNFSKKGDAHVIGAIALDVSLLGAHGGHAHQI